MSAEVYDFPTREPTLVELANSLETATDNLATAINREAEAHNAFLKAYHLAFLHSDVPVTIKSKDAEAKAGNELYAWNLAVAGRDACRAKAKELSDRLSAHQTHARLVADQT